MTAVYLIAAGVVAAGLVWFLTRPRHLTLQEEERLLREYFRRVDREERERERGG